MKYLTAGMTAIFGLFLFSCVCSVAAHDVDNEHPIVEAVLGGGAALPCNVSTPLEDGEATLILWYRLDLANPIYTLDVRSGSSTNSARHFPSDEMEGRARFDLQVHPPLLRLSDVKIEDEADYKCRVDLRKSRTLILHSRLKVIEPPNEPIIMDEHGQRLHDAVGPYDEGSTITFICEVDGGDPSPNVTWWRGSQIVDEEFVVIKHRFVRNELVLRNIGRSDLMAEFLCKASNTPLAKPRTSSVLLDLNLMPLEARILGMPMVLLASETREFTCETRGSRPRAYTSWWMEGQKVTSGVTEVTREGGNVTFSTLQLSPTPGDNGKRLVCKSANPSLPKRTVEDERILRVQFAPMVNLSVSSGFGPSGIREGSEVHLECSIWANPWIFEIAWQFEDRAIFSDSGSGVFVANQTLAIRRVQRDHRGRYRCIATNVVGPGYSNYLRLLIQFAPVCKHAESRVRGVSQSETLNVSCEVEADPADLSYRWSLDNSVETLDLTNWSQGDSVISYSPRVKRGYGTLMCWAKNTVGVQRDPCLIRIVPAGPPESPHDCSVTNQTLYSLSVECQPGYNGSLQQTFHLEVYNSIVEHMAHNLTATQRPKFRVSDLAPATSYVLVLYASNVKGRSNSVALVASTLSSAERRTTEEGVDSPFNPLFGVLIGAITVLVILAIVVIVFVLKGNSTKDHSEKDIVLAESPTVCDIPKKELDDSPESGSNKGPDIIPLSIEPDVYFTGRAPDDSLFGTKEDHAHIEYVHEKYTDTVL